jgi:hypothetical protein
MIHGAGPAGMQTAKAIWKKSLFVRHMKKRESMLFLFFLGMMGLVLTGRAIAVEVRGEYALRTAVTTVMCFLMAVILMILNLLR